MKAAFEKNAPDGETKLILEYMQATTDQDAENIIMRYSKITRLSPGRAEDTLNALIHLMGLVRRAHSFTPMAPGVPCTIPTHAKRESFSRGWLLGQATISCDHVTSV